MIPLQPSLAAAPAPALRSSDRRARRAFFAVLGASCLAAASFGAARAFAPAAPLPSPLGASGVELSEPPAPELERASPPASGLARDPEPSAAGAVPHDVTTTVARAEQGKLRVTVGRPGHLVMLRAGASRGAGHGSASILLDGLQKQAEEPLFWDTIDPSSLALARGVVRLSTGQGAEIVATPALIGYPASAATQDDHLHRCAAHGDGAGGFSVVCRLKPTAWRVGAASITGADPREDVWIMDARSVSTGSIDPTTGWSRVDTFVRMDLPLAPGAAEGRILTYMAAATGVVVRAEATRLPGEEPSILITSASRAQPVSFSLPMAPRRLKDKPTMSLDFL